MDNISSEEKRRYQRTLVDEIKRSAVIRPIDEESEIWGRIINRSEHGAQISLPIELSPDRRVEITIPHRDDDNTWAQDHYLGRICWCNPDVLMEDAFNVGIEFLD